MDALEKVIRPIVEGQIRGFLKEHPALVDAVDWYKPRKDKSITFVNSLAKRIVLDLVSPHSSRRIRAAVLEPPTGAAPISLNVGMGNCGETAGFGSISEPGSTAQNL